MFVTHCYVKLKRTNHFTSKYKSIQDNRGIYYEWTKYLTQFIQRNELTLILVEQELVTLPEHLSLPTGFCGIHLAQTLVFCIVLCTSFFFFSHHIVCSSPIYSFSLPLWSLQIFLIQVWDIGIWLYIVLNTVVTLLRSHLHQWIGLS
jgi:hypothetical protein